ncbi:SGNH/GDSL hydrolase family protein [Kutzneria buriramensis]|uniref:GDSL-like lipase/acylhydrolase family protein n=1 Tax=Kutzneria buriramensis TaxID=1045776 RepID=A0A3E0I0I8_9PSEU|nr:SGNH/GDSL hydrolase family protein [Kutzneria buriramensis]REH52229.1 GDSL-like lipase/acylhydrolase family protein [Kutzneria buriramensis]
MTLRRLLTAAVVVLTSLVCLGTGAAAAATPTYSRYVALGDSYTSGPFIPFLRLDPIGCVRSTNNYPALLAATLHVSSYTDVSCGGADTTNMTAAQSVPLFGTNPPQFNALRADTDLVTVGIGGNDDGVFGNVVGTCPGLRASDPTGAPCKAHFTVNGQDTLLASIAATQGRVTAVVQGIHQRSPHARVLVIGYPRIAPPTGTCPDVLPFADGDYPYLDSIEHALNAAVSNAAAAANATYVDTYGPSLGHDACAGDNAWVQGQSFDLFAAYPYHPRKAGMVGEAGIIAGVLGASRVVTTVTPHAPTASVSTLTALAHALVKG